MKKIVIVGGGFSGLMSAVHILKVSTESLQLHIINAGKKFPKGVAYSTDCDWHLLNVRAFNMSAFSDEPNHFIEWLKKHENYKNENEQELRIKFIPRKIYGDYLFSIWKGFQQEIKNSEKHVVTLNDSEAINSIVRNNEVEILLQSGEVIIADKIILATGHSAPTQPEFFSDEVASSKFYFGNPWSQWENNFSDEGSDAFIVGNGLTIVDTVLSLLNKNFKGKIYFNSRHGLLPLSHKEFIKNDFFSADDIAGKNLREFIKLYRHWAEHFKSEGKPEFLAVDKFRPVTQLVWKNFSLHEKKYFLRYLKTPWNVARHRIADEIFQILDKAMKDGKLIPVSGKVNLISAHDGHLSVQVKKSKNNVQSLRINYLFNCTGPKDSCKNSTNPFIRSLINSGETIPDDLDMGLKVSDNYAIVNSAGEISNSIFTTGFVVNGSYWESFAVPDLRKQVKEVSENLVASFVSKRNLVLK